LALQDVVIVSLLLC